MSPGPTLWLVMTLGGAALLGLALAYGMLSTRRRRENPVAQRLTDAGTREVYREEEERRERRESDADDAPAHAGGDEVTVTEARQGVTGHHVTAVLGISMLLTVLAGVALFGYLWI
jgi:Flp pilus assembly protein TadB